MLRDRKELLERDIRKLHDEAANMYLSIVIGGDVHNEEYQNLKQRITDLQFDLNAVNVLLAKGHK